MPYVYILASINRVLYVGSTDNLQQRVTNHRAGRGAAFTKKYRVHRLVYFETVEIGAARRRELEIKAWRREKKIALIESANPQWKNLELVPRAGTELDRVWGEEAERRYDEYLAGSAKAVPAEEVFARIRARKR